jgi:hypothetical protein
VGHGLKPPDRVTLQDCFSVTVLRYYSITPLGMKQGKLTTCRTILLQSNGFSCPWPVHPLTILILIVLQYHGVAALSAYVWCQRSMHVTRCGGHVTIWASRSRILLALRLLCIPRYACIDMVCWQPTYGRPLGICVMIKEYTYHTLWLTCDHLCPQNIRFCWRSDSMHIPLCNH